jgi:TIR domain
MEGNSSQPLEVFYCYARKDRALCEELNKHLTGLLRSGLITVWYDGNINPGTAWEAEIEAHLNTARIILLLVSPDFIASDYCYSKEMVRAIERHHAKDARVIPVLLRPVDWTDAPFHGLHGLQVLPSNAQPVTRWPDRDEAFQDIAEGIRRVVTEHPGPHAMIQQAQPKVKVDPPQHMPQETYNVQIVKGKGIIIGSHGKVEFNRK